MTIYLVTNSIHLEDILDGFATTSAEVAQLVADHVNYCCHCNPEKLRVVVNMKDGTATASADSWKATYIIHTIKRVGVRHAA